MLQTAPVGAASARKGSAMIGLLFCGCIGRVYRDNPGMKIETKEQQAAEHVQDLAVYRLRRLEQYEEESRGHVESRGALGIDRRGSRQLACRGGRYIAG